MKSNLGPLGPHETRSIIQQQIEGTLPIGPAFWHAGGRPLVASSHQPMQINFAEVSELVGLHPSRIGPLIKGRLE